MAKIPTKLVKGSRLHVDIKPDKVGYMQREDVGKIYFHLMFATYSRLFLFFCSVGVLLALMTATIMVSQWFILPAAIAFWSSLKVHDWYMTAWSRAGKFNRKTVARVDVAAERGAVRPSTVKVGKDYGFVQTWSPPDFNYGE